MAPPRSCKLYLLTIIINCLILLLLLVSRIRQSDHSTTLIESSHISHHHRYLLPHPRRRNKHPMSWVPLTEGTNVHHLVSAVYDDRMAVPLRPAVLVFGFVSFWQALDSSKLHCLLHYSINDGVAIGQECTSEPVKVDEDGKCDIMRKNRETAPVTYYCSPNHNNPSSKFRGQIPTQVQLSTDSSCRDKLSPPLKILYHGHRFSYKGKVGVCVHSALVPGQKQMGKDILEFVEMTRALGAESVTMYVSNTLDQDTKSLVQGLSRRGSRGAEGGGGGRGIAVNLVNWHGFRKGAPLHYYGQSLLMLDCIYRHMHQVELLVLLDLDEMIVPVSGMTWTDMIHKIDDKQHYSSYQFLNKFFVPSTTSTGGRGNTPDLDTVRGQSKATGPRYFSWTRKMNCHFAYGVRSKTIVRPELVLSTCVHQVKRSVKGTSANYKVPVTIGLLAHYRREIITQCTDRNFSIDSSALHYQHLFNQEETHLSD